ncbi:hypothetical protein JTE90_000965 [Oedothorax gibbosus]|uniref:Protein-tyrosine phosphatase receptor IA-2 ectodomain domain-containing protein n=1 Tax=Oedothorax gibbosus TaxID=931172 RepID=A0AAV6VBT8_9ARAC|nr:hypothetical protein JTE90_000965 [Oedothorax gibbosus]
MVTRQSESCLFSPNVCGLEEECYDDNVFGICQLPFGKDDIFLHDLNSEAVKLLETELSRLFAGGYRWEHEYAQCVIQNILYSNRHQISYDPGFCSRVLQFTLPEVPPEIFSELQTPDADELAFIKFKPNHDNSEGDVYADEIFNPPIFSERVAKEGDAAKLSDKRSPTPSRKWNKFDANQFDTNNFDTNKFGAKDEENGGFTDADVLMEELVKAAADTEKLLEGFQDHGDRYPDKNVPIRRTELSSDLNHFPVFTEGGTEWLPVDEDDTESSENEISEPYDKKRVKVINHFNNELEDNNILSINRPSDRYTNEVFKSAKPNIPEKEIFRSTADVEKESPFRHAEEPVKESSFRHIEEPEKDSSFRNKVKEPSFRNIVEPEKESESSIRNFEEESPTFGRSSEPFDEDSNFQWNTKHRSKALDDDLTRFAHGDRPRVILREEEPLEKSNVNDVIENDYIEDKLYAAILPTDKGFPTFTSDKRYDIKKPGPTYMFHEDEDGETSSEESQMAMQGADDLLKRLSKIPWQNQNQFHSLFDPPVRPIKQLSPFTHVFEATDEISRIYVTGESAEQEDSNKKDENNSKTQDKNPKPQNLERLSADQPEIIDDGGIDPSKPLQDEDKPSQVVKTVEGHKGRFDSADPGTTNLVVKEKNPTDENALELVKTLEKYLELGRGSFSNVKVNGQEITFKVNQNTRNFSASEVAAKAEELSSQLKEKTGLTVEEGGTGDKSDEYPFPLLPMLGTCEFSITTDHWRGGITVGGRME